MVSWPRKHKDKHDLKKTDWYKVTNGVYVVSVPLKAGIDMGGGIGAGLSGIKGEAGKKAEIDYISFIYDHGEIMPLLVWNEKKRLEILHEVKLGLAASNDTSPDNIELGALQNTKITWIPPHSNEKLKSRKSIGFRTKAKPRREKIRG